MTKDLLKTPESDDDDSAAAPFIYGTAVTVVTVVTLVKDLQSDPVPTEERWEWTGPVREFPSAAGAQRIRGRFRVVLILAASLQ